MSNCPILEKHLFLVHSNVANVNGICITDKNIRRKEKHQRPIKKISKSEFIIFNALLIAATANNERGCNIWADNCDIKKLVYYKILILEST